MALFRRSVDIENFTWLGRIVAIGIVTGCFWTPIMGEAMTNKAEAYTIPEDCNFGSVTHQFVSNECSPKVDRKFRGVIINAPKEVFYEPGHQEPFGGFAFIPICGMHVLTAGDPPKGKIPDILVLVAVDTVSKKSYSGRYVEPGMQLPHVFRSNVSRHPQDQLP
jgi:hypothetical protein